MYRYRFAISSHIKSYEKTYDRMVDSLIMSGVPKDDIFFFIGGFDRQEKAESRHSINMYYVRHNSMDMTGLISVLDLGLESDYWFLLHDTAYVGERFYEIVKRFDTAGRNTIAMTSDDRSMNMGSYRHGYLIDRKSDIMAFKNYDYSDGALQRIKRMNVINEDAFIEPGSPSYNSAKRIASEPTDFYSGGVNRIVEYFPEMDLFKIKANWHKKDKYEIEL